MAARKVTKKPAPPKPPYVPPPVPCCHKAVNRIVNLINSRIVNLKMRNRESLVAELQELREEIGSKFAIIVQKE